MCCVHLRVGQHEQQLIGVVARIVGAQGNSGFAVFDRLAHLAQLAPVDGTLHQRCHAVVQGFGQGSRSLAGLEALVVQAQQVTALGQLDPANGLPGAQFAHLFQQWQCVGVAGLFNQHVGVVDQQFGVMRPQSVGMLVGLESGAEFALLVQGKAQQPVGGEVAPVLAKYLAAQAGQQRPVGGGKCRMQAGLLLLGVFGLHVAADLQAKGAECGSVLCTKGGRPGGLCSWLLRCFGVYLSRDSTPWGIWFAWATMAVPAC